MDVSAYILPTAATMVGICLTGISVVRVMALHGARTSVAADGLAVASLLFLVAAILSYTSLRSPTAGKRLERYADLIFVVGLMLMVVLGFVLAWAVGDGVA